MANYKYLIFDAQYFLTRNFKQLCSTRWDYGEMYEVAGHIVEKPDGSPYRWCVPKFDKLELAKSFFWSIAKFCREHGYCEKVILAWDKYPYQREVILGKYKDTRHYATEDDLTGLDQEERAQDIIQIRYDIDTLAIKQDAKWFIINNFDNLGMKSYVKKGYEADDWAAIIAEHLWNKEPDTKSAIVSIDTDWKYWISPNVDYLHPRSGGTSHETMMQERSAIANEFGFSLFDIKAYWDSLYGSHNDLRQTISEKYLKTPFIEVLRSIKESDEMLENPELFRLQLKSFNYKEFPEFENVQKSLYYLDKGGHIDDMIEYAMFVSDTDFKVTESYYSDFTSGLNHKLYTQ